MRISDWSSDVCSSDLIAIAVARRTKKGRSIIDISKAAPLGFHPAACPSLVPNAYIMIAARTVIISSFAPTRGRTGGCTGFRCAECDPSVIGDLLAMTDTVPAIADLESDPPRRRVGTARPGAVSGCRSDD